MISMAVSKIDFAGNTLIDLTSDTVTASALLKGYTAHDKTGELVTGTLDVTADSSIHTVTSDCANANVVVEYFRKLRPDGCNDMIVAFKPPDGVTALSKLENGQMLTLTLNGTKAGYTRWYSSALNVQTTFTTSYVCKCWAGDEYYVHFLV